MIITGMIFRFGASIRVVMHEDLIWFTVYLDLVHDGLAHCYVEKVLKFAAQCIDRILRDIVWWISS
jgi:hypothetical protein